MLRAFLAQSILHSLIAALVVEGLLRSWRIDDAEWRLRFRVLPLAAPIVALPLLFLAAPWRMSPGFAADWALLAADRWNLLTVGSVGLWDFGLLLAAGAGSALFLRDAVPPLLEMIRRKPRTATGPWVGLPDAIEHSVWSLSARMGLDPPAIRMVRQPGPLLLCVGSRHPSLVISPATIARLSETELQAALAHELAHVAHRDPATGYVLMAARALTFFSPAAQWTARALVDDLERRADQASVRLIGAPQALATAIRTLFSATDPAPADRDAAFERLFWHTRRAGMEARCRRLQSPDAAVESTVNGRHMALAVVGLLAVLFFVV